MATRMLQRRGTAAEWAAENPVLSPGEMGFETDTKIIKMGDGVTAWADLGLPYLTTGGGTMTGALNLIAPTADAHAARKVDVDARLALAGGTMTGALNLIAPTADAHAARKVDVDSAAEAITTDTRAVMSATAMSLSGSGAGTVYLTVTYTPPAEWTTYRISAIATLMQYNTGSTVARSRLNIGATAGVQANKGASDPSKYLPTANEDSGISGSVVIDLEAWNSNGQGTVEGGNILFVAVRES